MNKNNQVSARPRMFPCGQTRREFVWEMGAGFSGMALAAQLATDGFFARHSEAAERPATTGPLAPTPPQPPTRVKSGIF